MAALQDHLHDWWNVFDFVAFGLATAAAFTRGALLLVAPALGIYTVQLFAPSSSWHPLRPSLLLPLRTPSPT